VKGNAATGRDHVKIALFATARLNFGASQAAAVEIFNGARQARYVDGAFLTRVRVARNGLRRLGGHRGRAVDA
jgi:hypothetical protein